MILRDLAEDALVGARRVRGEGRAGNLFIPERRGKGRKERPERASGETPVNEIGGVDRDCD